MSIIKEWVKKTVNYFVSPCPTLFDLCVCFGIMGIGFIRPALKGFYLEFYTIFLMVVGFNYRPKRYFNGACFTLLGLIGLICLFKYSYEVRPGGLSFQYLNFYLMHEGFGYVFFASLLFYIVTTKATNLRLLAIALPIAAWNWIDVMFYCGQMTPILALGVGFFTFLLYKRKFKWAMLVALIAMNIIAWNYKWVLMKFACRPHIWLDLILKIKEHPFVGSGYNKLLIPDNLVNIKTWGNTWLYRHNDPLSLLAYIGVFAIIPIVMFVRELLVRFKGTWFIAPTVAICALCAIQVTFIFGDKASIILLSLSWMYIES